LGARGDAPYVLSICEDDEQRDDEQRDDFLARADGELTAHLWHPSSTVDQHEYVGRRRILFCDGRGAHLGRSHARRVAPYPPGHPARLGHYAQVRGVKLPGSPSETESGESPRSTEAALVAGSLDGQPTGEAA
jgi:hypothetical protein